MKVLKVFMKDFYYNNSKDSYEVLVQYPWTEGEGWDYFDFTKNVHANGFKVVMDTLLTLSLISKSFGEFRVDMDIRSAQSFEVPMVFGGTHAVFLDTSQECNRIMRGL